jgi:hypothetical protein
VTSVTHSSTGKHLSLETGSAMTLTSAMLAATAMLLLTLLSCPDTTVDNSQKLDQVSQQYLFNQT